MARGETRSGDGRTFLQTVALVVAVVVGVLLIINLVRLGLSTVVGFVWLGLEIAVLVLTVAWARGRESWAWIGWVIAAIAAGLIVLSVADLGFGSFWDVLRVILLALVLVIAVGAVRRPRAGSRRG